MLSCCRCGVLLAHRIIIIICARIYIIKIKWITTANVVIIIIIIIIIDILIVIVVVIVCIKRW